MVLGVEGERWALVVDGGKEKERVESYGLDGVRAGVVGAGLCVDSRPVLVPGSGRFGVSLYPTLGSGPMTFWKYARDRWKNRVTVQCTFQMLS